MTLRFRLILAATALALLASVVPASAALITFGSRAAFDLATGGGLPVEDFEAIADPGVVGFTGPLDSTGAGPFGPGDILSGLTIAANFPQSGDLVAIGTSFGLGTTNTVGANFFFDSTNLLFASADAVGFDVYTFFGNNPVTVSVYGIGDVLLGAFPVAHGGFFGVINTSGLITRINVWDGIGDTSGDVEFVDNIAFGQVAPIPEPATLLLLGTGLGAVAARRRLKKRA